MAVTIMSSSNSNTAAPAAGKRDRASSSRSTSQPNLDVLRTKRDTGKEQSGAQQSSGKRSRICLQLTPFDETSQQVVQAQNLNTHIQVQDVKRKHSSDRIVRYLKTKWGSRVPVEDPESSAPDENAWKIELYDTSMNTIPRERAFGSLVSQTDPNSLKLKYRLVRTAKDLATVSSPTVSDAIPNRQEHTDAGPASSGKFFTPEDPPTFSRLNEHTQKLTSGQSEKVAAHIDDSMESSPTGSVVRNLLGTCGDSASPNNSKTQYHSGEVHACSSQSSERTARTRSSDEKLKRLIQDLCCASTERTEKIKQEVGTVHLSSLQAKLIDRIEEAVHELQSSISGGPHSASGEYRRDYSCVSSRTADVQPLSMVSGLGGHDGVFASQFCTSQDSCRTLDAKRKRIAPTNLSPTPLSHAVDASLSNSNNFPPLESTRVPMPPNDLWSQDYERQEGIDEQSKDWKPLGECSGSNNSSIHSTSIGFDDYPSFMVDKHGNIVTGESYQSSVF
eukprot:gb/GECG01003800.1/.p1 GENE.gb/GECG01003800.1/~~gb/GECG01003800.1/.p1  ORF type:complete len:503 (+),score=63.93 gb/GECG01003800.1/:1-1509(+)